MRPYPHWLMTKESRDKNKEALVGRKSPMEGKIRPEHSEWLRKAYLEGKKVAIRRPGELNPAWKGDAAGYDAIHKWLYNNKVRTGECNLCFSVSKTQFANISGTYQRDVTDFFEACVSCHRLFDYNRGVLL